MNSKSRLLEIMSKLDNSFKLKLNEDVDIDESGYSRLVNAASGNVDRINTYGIFTAENPMGIQSSKSDNTNRLNQLKSDLRNMGYGFVKLSGMYGILENSLGVPNITPNHIQSLSEKYEQESYVFGSKQRNNNDVYFKWDMINTDTRQPMDSSRFTILSNREGVNNSNDFYSMIKKVKFKIPFFDDNHTEPNVQTDKNDYVNQHNRF
jgi:hypothetical protein